MSVTVIGDIVSSKAFADRRGLQETVQRALDVVNERRVDAVEQPLRATVGDEFQGVFTTVPEAALATLLLRLQFLTADPMIDSRYGLGIGDYQVFSEHSSPVSQDGPGWWAARSAIETVHGTGARGGEASLRTWLCSWSQEAGAEPAATLNAFFRTRDALIASMSQRQRRLLLLLIEGKRQTQMATAEGISQGAVSQNLTASGASAVWAAQTDLFAAQQGAANDAWPPADRSAG